MTEEEKKPEVNLEEKPKVALEKEKPEDMVPATVVKVQRDRARAAELEAARLRGELDGVMSAQKAATDTQKSPLERYRDEVGGEYAPTTDVLIAQAKWDKEQSKAEIDRAEYDAHKADFDAGFTAGGEELVTLMRMGQHLLDKHDQAKIWDARKESGQVAKQLLIDSITRQGGDNAVRVQQMLQSETKDKEDKPEEKSEEKPEEDVEEIKENLVGIAARKLFN